MPNPHGAKNCKVVTPFAEACETAELLNFSALVSSEQKSRRYLLGFCWKNHQRHCLHCRARKLYKLADGRRRCAACGYTFHDFSRRFLKACNFSCRQWLWFLKLFELDATPRDMAGQLGVHYETVLKAQDAVRRALLAQSLDAPALFRAGLCSGPGSAPPAQPLQDAPVFGLIELNGLVLCDLLPDLTPAALLHFKTNFHLATASLGQVVYTAPYRQYLSLLCCGPALWPAQYVRHETKGLPVEANRFWLYAKRRFARLRGIAPAHFSLHLKELEFRFNHREARLFPLLAEAVCGVVPQG